jgi:hypothetical protein
MARTLALLTLILVGSPVAFALEIAACGTVVPAGETGVLTADLDCTSLGLPWALDLRERATLEW